ncbi:MAG: diaminopimelate epimerase, partial [Chthoniobacterales bacterium]
MFLRQKADYVAHPSNAHTMELAFTKMNGAGNDFILLDNRSKALSLSTSQIARLCDRHRGIGADGLLLVEPPAAGAADFRMRYYNADGGEAEMCGNGARCFSRYGARLLGETASSALSFETPAGVISASLLGEEVELAMSAPHSLAPSNDLTIEGTLVSTHSINTGVPHAVVFVDDLELADVRTLGARIRHHEHFAPAGTNVNFVAKTEEGIAIRTYERGVEDETLACGTGVVAAALIHHLLT